MFLIFRLKGLRPGLYSGNITYENFLRSLIILGLHNQLEQRLKGGCSQESCVSMKSLIEVYFERYVLYLKR